MQEIGAVFGELLNVHVDASPKLAPRLIVLNERIYHWRMVSRRNIVCMVPHQYLK